MIPSYFEIICFSLESLFLARFMDGHELHHSNKAVFGLDSWMGMGLIIGIRPCLVGGSKLYRLSHRMFGHMHEVLNIDYLRN